MTEAEKDLEAIKEAGAQTDFKKGNGIIRERDNWKQGGSFFDMMANYEYWDGSRLGWHVPRDDNYRPYWG